MVVTRKTPDTKKAAFTTAEPKKMEPKKAPVKTVEVPKKADARKVAAKPAAKQVSKPKK